ncbi:MAG: FAD-dependent thymidylate synthase [Candidatus Woesearchaeota archaeon]|jgi:thymidylate synthase ThyX|nr:FAD-dependent thymidylate synthase [Candidatus Woesearchaeota archaeon]
MKDLYEKTGTLAPILNKREYTKDEKTVLLHFFTNIDKNVYCATDAMSSQLYAFLMGQYSRTSYSMRDRFLQLFEDAQKNFDEGKITKDDFISLGDLAESIKNDNRKGIQYFNDKAAIFLKKWGVDYGHNSLKDADRIRFAVENISEVFTKVIEAPFPTLGDFQEKSTRYVSFSKENIIYSPKLEKSKFGPKIKEYMEELMDLYEKYLPVVKDVLVGNKVINRKDFQRESAFERTLNAKAFDIVRYLLPTGVATSLGCGFSARTAESHISEMLSHPLEEVRLVAKSMHEEAIKVSPGLLTHVKENEYLRIKREKTQTITEDIFEKSYLGDIHHGIEDCNRVKLISSDNLDNIIVASILYENSRKKGISFLDCQNRAEYLSQNVKEKIIEAELGDRGQFDRMPRTIRHGKIIFEFLTDAGAYRDYQRHRASPQLYQGMGAIHGYDYPEYMDLLGMEEFTKDYDEIMTKITNLSREVIKEEIYETEYIAALGHLLRTTFEMDPGQLAYIIELRTTPHGHHSYRKLFQEVYKLVQLKAPIFSKYIRVDQDLQATRVKQEEKAAKKREELGLN